MAWSARVVAGYVATRPDEITLKVGQIVFVVEESVDGWIQVKTGQRAGWYPRNYVVKAEAYSAARNPQRVSKQGTEPNNLANHRRPSGGVQRPCGSDTNPFRGTQQEVVDSRAARHPSTGTDSSSSSPPKSSAGSSSAGSSTNPFVAAGSARQPDSPDPQGAAGELSSPVQVLLNRQSQPNARSNSGGTSVASSRTGHDYRSIDQLTGVGGSPNPGMRARAATADGRPRNGAGERPRQPAQANPPSAVQGGPGAQRHSTLPADLARQFEDVKSMLLSYDDGERLSPKEPVRRDSTISETTFILSPPRTQTVTPNIASPRQQPSAAAVTARSQAAGELATGGLTDVPPPLPPAREDTFVKGSNKGKLVSYSRTEEMLVGDSLPSLLMALPGMNSPDMRGHGDLLETGVMLHRTNPKEKGKLRHLFLFENALIVSKFKGKSYNTKAKILFRDTLQVVDARWNPLPSDEKVAAPHKCFEIFDTATGKRPHIFAAEVRDTTDTKTRMFKKIAAVLNSPMLDQNSDEASKFADETRRKKTMEELDREATDFLLGIRMFANDGDGTGAAEREPQRNAAGMPSSQSSPPEDVYEVVLPEVVAGELQQGNYDNLGGADTSDDETPFTSLKSRASTEGSVYDAMEQQRLQDALTATQSDLEAQRKHTTELMSLVSALRRSLKRAQCENAELRWKLTHSPKKDD